MSKTSPSTTPPAAPRAGAFRLTVASAPDLPHAVAASRERPTPTTLRGVSSYVLVAGLHPV